MIDGSAFTDTGISEIIVEKGNRHFQVSGDFLLTLEGARVIR
jgi:hypothetical protein